ncbi:MAG: polysaccharide deacetylase family protein, partial [Chloroflexota bacterium]
MNALLAAAILLAALAPAPRKAIIVVQGSGKARVVALSFDAGADRGYAPRILRTLEHLHVKASFGMTGRWALANPGLVKRIARDGNVFINHTYDHRSFTGYSTKTAPLTARRRRWEIVHTQSIIHRLTGKTPKPFFRPPYGDYDPATLTQVRSLGYRYMVMWTIDTLGWEGLTREAILLRTLSLVKPGAII